METATKFVADAMLGRLAKRMRLLGFDVLYDRSFHDNEIIRLSIEQERVILTRDTALTKRPLASNHLFIKYDAVREQLDQVLGMFPQASDHTPFSRCSECNQLLISTPKGRIKDLVPPYVYQKQENFLLCPECKRIYWEGTHVRRMAIPAQKKKNWIATSPAGGPRAYDQKKA